MDSAAMSQGKPLEAPESDVHHAVMDQPPAQPRFIVDGNRLTLLDTGPRRLDALIALIEGARETLRILKRNQRLKIDAAVAASMCNYELREAYMIS